MTYSTDLFLMGFAPLLQIWGGICLLFFYLEFLNKSPLTKRWKKSIDDLKECCEKLLTKFLALLSDPDALLDFYCDLDTINVNKCRMPRWEKARTAVYSLAKFAFFHVAILLVYCGLEEYLLCECLYPSLLIVDLIAIIYIIVALVSYNCKFIQHDWGVYLCVALMISSMLGYHFIVSSSPILQKFILHLVPRTPVTIISLVVCLFAYFLPVLSILARSIEEIRTCDRSIKKIDALSSAWADFSKINLLLVYISLYYKARKNKNASILANKTGRELAKVYIQQKINNKLVPAMRRIRQNFEAVDADSHE